MTTDTLQAAARERASTLPIDAIDPSDESYFRNDTIKHYFRRLRDDDPVHWTENANYGGFWSITKFDDIMKVDTNWKVFSSSYRHGGITINDRPEAQMFIAMDPPEHNVQRKAVENSMAPANLAKLESLVRERTAGVLDALPRGETFDWVERVSKPLTALMLGTLFDMPEEDAPNIPIWTEKLVSFPGVHGRYANDAEKVADLKDMFDYFEAMWERKRHEAPGFDLISMLVHNPTTSAMSRADFHGNLRLLVVGGNDTTRNSMTGGLIALHDNPDEFAKLRGDHDLIDSLVSEIIRWQTPLAHMRRTATEDYELRGKTIRKGDKVIMWYLSGNFDDEKIEDAESFRIDRPRARQHLAFGFGLHRCLGNRVAELQLRVLWEEILNRIDRVEIVAPPVHNEHNFVRGYEQLMVRLPA